MRFENRVASLPSPPPTAGKRRGQGESAGWTFWSRGGPVEVGAGEYPGDVPIAEYDPQHD